MGEYNTCQKIQGIAASGQYTAAVVILNNCSFPSLSQPVSPQYKTRHIKKTALEGQSLSSIHLEIDTQRQENEAKQTPFASAVSSNTTLGKGITITNSSPISV